MGRFTGRWSLAALMIVMRLGASAMGAPEGEEEAVTVFRTVSPRVVSLQNAEGSGTGIILKEDGTILTNAHVVSSPLPYTVTVDVMTGGKTRSVTFKKMTVLGYHPSMDLALVKVDPKEHGVVLPSAEVSKTKGQAGQRIYAIGNPAAGGKVMNKTITSGMLSAVDREVDGAAYYQTDAAINPGNSGGPICDRTGKVLGLVTFKFEDVSAIGFAIPLHDLDVKKFLPLSERKANPERARAYLKLAERYGEIAEAAAKRFGMQSDERLMANYYACMCYRLALMEDPGNSATCYNIGMLLRTLDENEVAAAYLAMAIQLGPWDTTNGDPYRELGFSLAKQKKDVEALVAWKEGLAKIPYAGKIWEDLSIYYLDHNDPSEAAYAAAVALALPGEDLRRNVLMGAERDARAKLSAEKLAKLNERTTGPSITAELRKMLDESNKARKARKLAVTEAFAKLMESIGVAPIAGTDAKISQTPLKLPEVTVTDRGAVDPPPAANSKAPGRTSGAWEVKPQAPATGAAVPKPRAVGPGDWIGPGTFKPSAPVASNRSVAGPSRSVNRASLTPLEPEHVVAATWSSDAKHVFILEDNGTLSKVSVPELKEVKRCNVPGNCTGLTACKTGLVIASPSTQEIWVLNEELETLKSIAVLNPQVISSARTITKVFASGADDHMTIVDAQTGSSVSMRVADLRLERHHPNFQFFEVTPDGKYLFCEGRGALHRMKIQGDTMVYDGEGPGIALTHPEQIVVSPDSKYVAILAGGGNDGIGGKKLRYGTYVFSVEDLQTPAMAIQSGAYPQTLGFDTKAKLIYAQNYDAQVRVFTPQGNLQGDYKWKDHSASAFLVHPEGRKLFVKVDQKLSWLELPDLSKPVPRAKDEIDLLALIDSKVDGMQGKWTVKDGVLSSDKGKQSIIEVPYVVPQEYDLRIEFQRLEGTEAMHVTLSHGETEFAWCMADFRNTKYGFQMIDGKGHTNNGTGKSVESMFDNGMTYTLLIKVRDKGVEASIDGEVISTYEKAYSAMTLPKNHKPRHSGALAILTWNSQYRISEIGLTEVTGHGKAVRPK